MLNWLTQQLSSIPIEIHFLLAIALIVSMVGFYRLVYFISIGYAFSITGMAAFCFLFWQNRISLFPGLQTIVLAAYGLRLGVYLVHRETKPAYHAESGGVSGQARVSGQSMMIWIGVSVLYVMMFSPCLFSWAMLQAETAYQGPIVPFIGLALMAGGLGLETLADWQKSVYKARFPKRFCDTGVYRWVRCPNYLGEIVFWTGNFVTSLAAYSSLLRWVIAFIGLACIVLIMMGSTKRLERSQAQRYGNLPEYDHYAHTVPVLFPFVPLYSLQGIRVYLE